MEINAILLANLADMERHELNKIIEDDYYRQIIACDADGKAINKVIDSIISDIRVVEEAAARIERFDLAEICVTHCEQLVGQISLKSLLN